MAFGKLKITHHKFPIQFNSRVQGTAGPIPAFVMQSAQAHVGFGALTDECGSCFQRAISYDRDCREIVIEGLGIGYLDGI